MEHMIVVRSFGPWRIGDLVTDQPSIEKIQASEHVGHVVRINPVEEI